MKDNIQFLVVILLFGYIVWLQQCGPAATPSQTLQTKIDTIIRLDTQMPPNIIVQLPRQHVPEPIIIYLDSSKNIVYGNQVDTTRHQKARLYRDSIADDNLTLFYTSMVDGELLQNALDYRLKVPKSITKTVTITKPVPTPASLFLLNLGAGGKFGDYASISVGAQFVHSKGWAIGYDYDVLQNSHHIKLGIKLFQLKK